MSDATTTEEQKISLKPISNLDGIVNIETDDLIEVSQVDTTNGYISKKIKFGDLVQQITKSQMDGGTDVTTEVEEIDNTPYVTKTGNQAVNDEITKSNKNFQNWNLTCNTLDTTGITVGDDGIDAGSSTIKCGTLDGVALKAKWADLAEVYESDDIYQPGTLVKFGGEKELTLATNEAHAVVTKTPGFILNSGIKGTAIALVGRTPVLVKGSVSKFDDLYLSQTTPGVATTEEDGKIIGKALDSLEQDDDSIGLVECVVRMQF